MIKEYFSNLKNLWLGPAEFFEMNLGSEPEKHAIRFAALTSLLVALELGLVEILSDSSKVTVGIILALMLIGMPFLIVLWVYLWTAFMRLCAYLLGESLPADKVRLVVAYSAAGLVALGLGFGVGIWLALMVFVFQVIGIEKILGYSRWTAAVYVGLPFSLIAVLAGFFTLMFKVIK